MTNIPEELIAKFIAGSCSDEELQHLKLWMDQSDENARYIFELEKTSAFSEGLRKADTAARDRVWGAVSRRIDADKMYQARTRRLRIYRRIAAAAVFIGVIVCAAVFLTAPKVQMVTVTAEAESMFVTLPDSSRVWLNKHASITYPETFADNCREVSVTGEAYFEVTRDPARPFTAEGKWLNVTVLGTRFNFHSSSSATAEASVSLLEGKVEVTPGRDGDGVVLAPGQKATFDPATGQLSVVNTNTTLDAVWHDRMIHFKGSNIRQIAVDLEKLYGVHISLRPSVDTSRTYSGETFYYDSLDSTLNALCTTLPLRYTRQGSNIILSSK